MALFMGPLRYRGSRLLLLRVVRAFSVQAAKVVGRAGFV